MGAKLPCLPLIQERFWNEIKDSLDEKERTYCPDFKFTMFEQVWGSTALGFGGIGGQAMTSAYTTVVIEVYSGWAGVFFDENLAYKIKNPNQKFYEDVHNGQMNEVRKSSIYKRKE